MIQSLWGASNVSNLIPAGDSAVPPAPALLKLECRNRSFGKVCGATWESASFTECPGCGQRRFVHKVEAEAV